MATLRTDSAKWTDQTFRDSGMLSQDHSSPTVPDITSQLLQSGTVWFMSDFYLDSPKENSKYSISLSHLTKGMPDLADPVEHNKHTDITHTDTHELEQVLQTNYTDKWDKSLHSPVWAHWCITVHSAQSVNMKIWIINVVTIFRNYAHPFFKLCG